MKLDRLLGAALVLTAAATGTLAARALPVEPHPLPARGVTASDPEYLFIWSGDAAHTLSDFLAVIEADPSSPSYGKVVASVPAGAAATMPHHLPYAFPRDGLLLANGWVAGRTFLFDLRTPTAPKLTTSFTTVGTFAYPHSFAPLPNGHVIATFQGHLGNFAPPGGLAELDKQGHFIRGTSAATSTLADTLAWPYSLAIDSSHDRIVVTNTTMVMPKWWHQPAASWRKSRVDSLVTSQVQIWSLSALKPLVTLSLPVPPGPKVKTPSNEFAAEPRLLPDGTMYVTTSNCGLYHLTGIATTTPHATLVHTFPISTDNYCAVPAIVGHYWIQTDMALHGLIALDIRDPAHPVEVSRLVLDSLHMMPHWLAPDTHRSRVVLTGDEMGYVLIVNVDPATGKLAIDRSFRDERTGATGVSLDGRTWSWGRIGKVAAHGALFGPL